MQQFTIDGNFTAQHLRQKGADNDVWLSDASGFMVERTKYKEHLETAKTYKEVDILI
jgi:hypothetical protein